MTREEEVKIISERYGANSLMYGKLHNDTLKGLLKHYQEGFVAGVKWADKNPKSPWISVEDDLPCNHDELIITNCYYDGKETINVITINKRGVVNENFMIFYDKKWEWGFSTAPCYWMPIPKLPKE